MLKHLLSHWVLFGRQAGDQREVFFGPPPSGAISKRSVAEIGRDWPPLHPSKVPSVVAPPSFSPCRDFPLLAKLMSFDSLDVDELSSSWMKLHHLAGLYQHISAFYPQICGGWEEWLFGLITYSPSAPYCAHLRCQAMYCLPPCVTHRFILVLKWNELSIAKWKHHGKFI